VSYRLSATGSWIGRESLESNEFAADKDPLRSLCFNSCADGGSFGLKVVLLSKNSARIFVSLVPKRSDASLSLGLYINRDSDADFLKQGVKTLLAGGS